MCKAIRMSMGRREESKTKLKYQGQKNFSPVVLATTESVKDLLFMEGPDFSFCVVLDTGVCFLDLQKL